MNDESSLYSEAESLLLRLFELAVAKLNERGILMQYSPSVIQWFVQQPEWQDSLNPLRTLNGFWGRVVGSALETLLLEHRLQARDRLVVRMAETPAGRNVHFDIEPHP